jgi:hypothetical protein
MTNTINTNQPEVKRWTADERLAPFLLFLGLFIVPVAFGVLGIFGDAQRNIATWVRQLGGILLIVLWLLAFCSCLASAFLSLCPLPKKFVLAFVAAGLFAMDNWLSLMACVLIFDLN